jgi:hypothetical protein
VYPEVLPPHSRNGHTEDSAPPESWSLRPNDGVLAKPAVLERHPVIDRSAFDEPTVERIKQLPKEVGVLLLSVGVVGFVLPGMIGVPALMAGGLVLWPRAFNGLENWFARRSPALHHRGMQQMRRFLDDLERRYPSEGNSQ